MILQFMLTIESAHLDEEKLTFKQSTFWNVNFP